MNLDPMLKRLGLSTVLRVLPELIPMAEKEAWSYQQFLERLISEEIAQRLDCGKRTIERKLTLIRRTWQETFDEFEKRDEKTP